jgi:hypothetical protein
VSGTTTLAECMRQLFAGREDRYAVCGSGDDDSTWKCNPIRGPLTHQSIADFHLGGRQCLGFYFHQRDNSVRCTCCDIDNHEQSNPKWREQTDEVYQLAVGYGVRVLPEISQSGEGAHVWIFFSDAAPAWLVRQFWRALESKLSFKLKEVYPKQDELPPAENENGKPATDPVGNLVRLPLWNQSRFVDVENEWATIEPEVALADAERHRLSAGEISGLIFRITGKLAQAPSRKLSAGAPPDAADIGIALSALKALPSEFAEDYELWLQVGMSLKAVDEELCNDWDSWSKQSTKYRAGDCARKWRTFNRSGLGIGSLIYWAQQNGWTLPARKVDSRTKIRTGIKDLSVVTPLAWEALQAANDPPTLFRYGGVASRIESGDEGEPVIRALEFNRMRHHLARAATWIEYKKKGNEVIEHPVAPPKDVVNDVLATPDQPLPLLTRIVEAPVFAADGSLQTMPGYHLKGQTFYSPAVGFDVPEVPAHPEGHDIESARTLICDELLCDFPFVGDAEKAHAVALLLLPFARDLIAGPTPLHLFEKPSPGTGATLLVDVLSLPMTGRPIPAMTEGRDEDEWRKRITAKLRSGSSFILIDNLRRRLDSAAMSAGITSTTWEDRILGVSEMARLPVRCVWVATGNNPTVSTEIARRTVRIRMDAKLDRPWLRSGFRHDSLHKWTLDNRGLLVWAALTLVRAWIAAGRPVGETKLGMFECWSEVMGGILLVAGVPGLLSNAAAFYDESDTEGEAWRAFLASWWERFGDRETTVKELWHIDDGSLELGDKSEQSQRSRLGKLLTQHRDRVFDLENGTLRVVLKRGPEFRRACQWQLIQRREV